MRFESAWISASANSSVPYFSHGRVEWTFLPGPITPSWCSSSSQCRPVWNTNEFRPYRWMMSAAFMFTSPSSALLFATLPAAEMYQAVSWHVDSLPYPTLNRARQPLMHPWHACGRRSSVGGGVIVNGDGSPPRCDHCLKSGCSQLVTYFSFRANRAWSSALGSATVIDPVPITLMAFRFFEPHTAPNPPCPAPFPASWIRLP
jgi:hypothetical protein